jgi:hypothetical protein
MTLYLLNSCSSLLKATGLLTSAYSSALPLLTSSSSSASLLSKSSNREFIISLDFSTDIFG